MTARTWRLELVYDRLPLSLNDRSHWAVRNRAAVGLRDRVRVLARAQNIPRLEAIHVEMLWTPKDRRTRDADNTILTLKAAIDGMRDYPALYRDARMISPPWVGIVADDDPAHVTWTPPVIQPPDKTLTKRLVLTITEREAQP